MLIILPFGMTGCFKKEVQEEARQGQTEVQGGIKVNEPNTIMGWLKSGKGMECEIMSPEGDKMIVLAKENKVKISGFPYFDMANPDPEETVAGHSLTIGDMMYMWGGKNGMKMDMKKMEEMAQELGEEASEEEPDTWEDMISDLDEQNADYDCREKRIFASDFEVPTDVVFQDLGGFMEGMADMSKQMQDGLGGKGEFDLEAMQKQAEEFQEQYKLE